MSSPKDVSPFQIIANSVTEAVIIHDGKEVVCVNDAFRDLFGYGAMPVGALDLSVACAPEEIEKIQAMIRKGTTTPYTAKFLRLDKSGFLGEVRVKSIVFEERPARVVCIKDVTAERKAAEDVKKHEEEIKVLFRARENAAIESSRLKSEFLANMSHEIRTPLNGIIGTTDLLLEEELTPKQKTYVEMIRQSGQGLTVIINDILDFSKIEAGKYHLNLKPFNLITSTKAQIDLLGVKAEEKNIGLRLTIDPRVSATFVGDRDRISQVLINLVGNAIKFTHVGQVIVTIKVLQESAASILLRFSVKDSGIGIDEYTKNILFKPFIQADASTTRRFGGTGLGLSISKSLVELMDGRIGVDSEFGKGSDFWFEIALARIDKAPEEDIVVPVSTRKLAEKRPEKILLAEDNATNRVLALANLTALGFESFVAENGLEVLEKIAQDKYDLILMDCQMPFLDGFETTRRIRIAEAKTGLKIPIVALTANAMKEDEARCLASGMDDYISKPFKRKELAAIIEKWLTKT